MSWHGSYYPCGNGKQLESPRPQHARTHSQVYETFKRELLESEPVRANVKSSRCGKRSSGRRSDSVVTKSRRAAAAPRTLSGTPWRSPSKSYSPGVIGLHEEIEDFFRWMSPSAAELKMRQDVVNRVSKIIKRKYPHALIHCFGSYQTQLFLPSSDIDMVVFGKWEQLPLHTLQEEMIRAGFCNRDGVKILDKASVPIVKIMDLWTQVKVDISFNMVNGINGAKWINEQIVIFPCLPKLVLLLKQFLQQRDLNEVFTGGISSYSLILLVVSFLQLHPRYHPVNPNTNLGVLLIEFFELYGRHFNYSKVAIRVMNGGSYMPRKMMNSLATEEKSKNQKPGLLSIEDPLQVGHDIAKSSYGVMDVKNAFDYAYAQLVRVTLSRSENFQSILSTIIHVKPDVVDYRRWTEVEYS